MATILRLGPNDHGRRLSWDEFMQADGEEGFRYELIDGKVYVSPVPNLPFDQVKEWIAARLQEYMRQHPEVINYVSGAARLFVPGRKDITAPEPDQAAYHAFPRDLPLEEVQWEDVSPILVVEVLSQGEHDKDLVRNVDLYLQVPSIKEYWIVDTRPGAAEPELIVHRRHGGRWRVRTVTFGETYTTRLLPDFSLVVNPRT